MYDAEEFLVASEEALIANGVPADLALLCAHILNCQNLGLLPCPLEEPELSIVRSLSQQGTFAAEDTAV